MITIPITCYVSTLLVFSHGHFMIGISRFMTVKGIPIVDNIQRCLSKFCNEMSSQLKTNQHISLMHLFALTWAFLTAMTVHVLMAIDAVTRVGSLKCENKSIVIIEHLFSCDHFVVGSHQQHKHSQQNTSQLLL